MKVADQASNLRDLMSNEDEISDSTPTDVKRQSLGATAEVITVTSGKGGVGKSNLAVNLGIALAQNGCEVAVADMDLGLANVNVITGTSPKYNLNDVLENRKNVNEILESAPGGVQILAGISGKEELANLNEIQRRSLLKELGALDQLVDYLIIDTSAGLSKAVLEFVCAADRSVLVTTPEPTAITDAYAIIKSGMDRDPKPNFELVINRAGSIMEAKKIAEKMKRVGNEFLNVPLTVLGYIIEDDAVMRAVRKRNPFFIEYPNSKASQCISHLSERLENGASLQQTGGAKGFFKRIIDWMNR